MQMFVCENCGCVDSLMARSLMSDLPVKLEGEFICSQCRTGEWHHMFDKERYDPSIHRGLLNRPDQGSPDDSEASFG